MFGARMGNVWRWSTLAVAAALGSGLTLSAPASAVRRFDLKACLRMAEQHHPKIAESRAKLARRRGVALEARLAPFGEFRVEGGISPAPAIYGSPIYSPNTQVPFTQNLSLAWQMSFSGVVPLWTFGKLGAAWAAADADVQVGAHEVQKSMNEVRLDVRRAYYGVLLARDSLALVGEAATQLDRQIHKSEEASEEGDGDDIQLLKTRVFREELVLRESQARLGSEQALAGLRFLTGGGASLDVPDEPLARVSHELAPLAVYLRAARLHRPEINMARAAVNARAAQVDLARARFFPDLGVGLSAIWRRAPDIADQQNPFVSDPNIFGYGFGLALRYNLDALPQIARVAQAEAQLAEQTAVERFALGGVGVEVENAYAEASDALRRLGAMTRATTYARRWLLKVQQGIDVGTGDDKDLTEPAREYATRRFARMQATYDYNLALGKLALATGWEALDLRQR